MTELLFWFGWAGLFAGVTLGWYRMAWLMTQAATAGAAALVVFALQGAGPWDAVRDGATPHSVALATLIYLEVVSLAAMGWMFGRWRRNVQQD